MKVIGAEFVKSVTGFDKRKQLDHPEVCFIGRSNVGKSSMINSLIMQKLARTSSTPGATRMINVYKVFYEYSGEKGIVDFSDFPGFGYSKVSRELHSTWEKMIESYVSKRNLNRMVIWVYDIRREFDALDKSVVEWLKERRLDTVFVLTKSDKVGRQESVEKRRRFAEIFGDSKVFLFSSKDGLGRESLLSAIFERVSHARAGMPDMSMGRNEA